MMTLLIVAGGCFVIMLFIIINGLRIIPQSYVVIVERLGKYHKTMSTGINLIIPFIDKTRPKIDLRERVYDYPNQTVITKDNVTIAINGILYYQITDPFKAVYEVQDCVIAMEKLTQTTMRNLVGELELDETLTSRDTINNKLRDILDEATDKWGIKVNRVELQDIIPPKAIQEAMEKQMRAERERREMILKAEGEKKAKVLQAEGERDKLIAEAEGEKQSNILRATGEAQAKLALAEAEAKSLQIINDNLKTSNMSAAQYMVALKYIEALKDVSTVQGEKVVFMPYESSALLGSVSSLKEIFK